MTEQRTVGVEEELLVVDAQTGALAPAAPELLGLDPAATARFGLSGEFKREQIEIATRPWARMSDLTADLERCHDDLATIAAPLGLAACASGTSPFPGHPTSMPGDRFARIGAEFGLMATQQLTCGLHVHVSVESPDEGIAVLDRLRSWLAPLIAIAANSPYWQGEDTGYASYRTVVLSMLPPSGPAPIWHDGASYRRALELTMATGAAFDPAMIYYEARLSARYPTVELRVADVGADPELTVTIAALGRAMVDTAASQARAGREPLDLPVPVLRSASWRAARYGLSGDLFDPWSLRLRPAGDVLDTMRSELAEALGRNDDSDLVDRALARVRRTGTGAERQRALRTLGRPFGEVLLAARPDTTQRASEPSVVAVEGLPARLG